MSGRRLVSLVALLLMAPAPGSAQELQSFQDLALRVNLDDQLRVDDRSGSEPTGRLTRLTADELTLQTAAGEKRFTREAVRQVVATHCAWPCSLGPVHGSLIHKTTVVYPEKPTRTVVVPAVSRDLVGVRVSRRW